MTFEEALTEMKKGKTIKLYSVKYRITDNYIENTGISVSNNFFRNNDDTEVEKFNRDPDFIDTRYILSNEWSIDNEEEKQISQNKLDIQNQIIDLNNLNMKLKNENNKLIKKCIHLKKKLNSKFSLKEIERRCSNLHDIWSDWYIHQHYNSTPENIENWDSLSHTQYKYLDECTKKKVRKIYKRIVSLRKIKTKF